MTDYYVSYLSITCIIMALWMIFERPLRFRWWRDCILLTDSFIKVKLIFGSQLSNFEDFIRWSTFHRWIIAWPRHGRPTKRTNQTKPSTGLFSYAFIDVKLNLLADSYRWNRRCNRSLRDTHERTKTESHRTEPNRAEFHISLFTLIYWQTRISFFSSCKNRISMFLIKFPKKK